jgi:predicted oxidoreductase (fatty acid repression mutant protein)
LPQQARRTQYALTKKSTLPDSQLKAIVETAVKNTPSPYNSQSARVVLLLGKESDKLWDIVKTNYLPTLGGDGEYMR